MPPLAPLPFPVQPFVALDKVDLPCLRATAKLTTLNRPDSNLWASSSLDVAVGAKTGGVAACVIESGRPE